VSTTTETAWDRCFRKKLFFEPADAEEHIRRLWAAHGAHDMEVYACQIGNGGPHFHVGHHAHPQRAEELQKLRTVGRQTVMTRR
jgi:hypothetical protein